LKKVYEFCKDGKPGPVSSKLYNWLTSIQTGDKEDIFGWIDLVE
jgi:branched-chain amino acid aminotransferase